MSCEKNTDLMNDVSSQRENDMDKNISEQTGATMTNETFLEEHITQSERNEVSETSVIVPAVNAAVQKNPKHENKEHERMANSLREFRIDQMMSKAELARKAGLSVLTIDRIEKGFGCRMDTKRKILKALGLKLSDRRKLFQEE